MPGPYGVTSTGFVAKPLADIKTDLEARFRTTFGNGIDLSPNSVFAELIGIFADRLADAWQLGQALYANAYTDGAQGAALDQLCALTGVARKPATSSRVSATLTGTPGTFIAAGKRISVTGIGSKFSNVSSGTIGGGGTLVLEFTAVSTGPIVAPAGTLTTIETPVPGWASVTNPLDQSYLGTDLESDSALRLRRELSLRALGGAASAAIQAALFEVPNVTDALVFANETDATDANGLPPHSFECVVNGGLDADIAAKILATKPVGIATYGTTSISANDSGGQPHTIKFSRPTVLNIYVTIDVIARASVAPSNLAALISAAVAAFGDLNYNVGDPVIAAAMLPTVFNASAGVLDVPSVKIGTTASPTLSTTIRPTSRQIADLDTSRIVVNLTLT
jgi:uncharacterized phage protein gp47/JayE